MVLWFNVKQKEPAPGHPYLAGNFAPVLEEYVNYPCSIIQGALPNELAGGQYVRNGGNPANPPEEGRNYHWFDGDGMLHGVFFRKSSGKEGKITPFYTNRHVATPILALSLLLLRAPLPSIALLISPLTSLHRIMAAIITTFLLAFEAGVGTLSVVNTNVLWWGTGLGTEAEEERNASQDKPSKRKQDGRLLALCESGPPMEMRIPELETVDWDRLEDEKGQSLRTKRSKWNPKSWSLARLQEDWMTAHPRVDPVNGDLIFYQCGMFEKPYLRYSVIDRYGKHQIWKMGVEIGKAKMMHDFACSRKYTIFLNLPLTLSPFNMLSWPPRPMIHFDRNLPSEFIVLPRRDDGNIKPVRFVDEEPSMIFHTANAWDDISEKNGEEVIDMVACRFKSAKLVYAAGAVAIPAEEVRAGFDDVVRLHYYRFLFSKDGSPQISHCFPLSEIPFEFPATHPEKLMSKARYVYGCTMLEGGFDERLGGAAKVDVLVKVDVVTLSEKGRLRGEGKNCAVDRRTVLQIQEDNKAGKTDGLQVFVLPTGWYAQESRFVPREGALEEDDGWLLSYIYDESYIDERGVAFNAEGTGSELWVIDAQTMWKGEEAVVCRIKLPQRVPYGLHGTWVPNSQVDNQRTLETPLPFQPPLVQKIMSSRFRHFFNVFKARPLRREKSLIEKAAFGVMFPLAWVMLLAATAEVIKDYERRSGELQWLQWVKTGMSQGMTLERFPLVPLASAGVCSMLGVFVFRLTRLVLE